jgi:hypothetical protein
MSWLQITTISILFVACSANRVATCYSVSDTATRIQRLLASGTALTPVFVQQNWRSSLRTERSPNTDRDVTFLYESQLQQPDACLCCTTFIFDNDAVGEPQHLHAVVIYHASATREQAITALETIGRSLPSEGPFDSNRDVYELHGSWVAYVYYPVPAPPNSP